MHCKDKVNRKNFSVDASLTSTNELNEGYTPEHVVDTRDEVHRRRWPELSRDASLTNPTLCSQTVGQLQIFFTPPLPNLPPRPRPTRPNEPCDNPKSKHSKLHHGQNISETHWCVDLYIVRVDLSFLKHAKTSARIYSTQCSAESTVRRPIIQVRSIHTGMSITFKHQEPKSHRVDDLKGVLERAAMSGVERIFVTAGSLSEAREAQESLLRGPLYHLMPRENAVASPSCPKLYTTVGVHPTRANEFFEAEGGPSSHLSALLKLASEGGKLVVAIGECGLDYDRLSFCQKDTQIEAFKLHFELARQTKLPMFLHCRAAATDLISILRENRSSMAAGGVVHSFDGTLDEALTLTNELGLYIGLNGCSLRTSDSLEVVKELPLDRLLLETDAPWCDIRPTHASYRLSQGSGVTSNPWIPAFKKEKWTQGHLVKGRNEPCTLPQVLRVVATLKGLHVERVAAQIYANSLRLFFPQEPLIGDLL